MNPILTSELAVMLGTGLTTLYLHRRIKVKQNSPRFLPPQGTDKFLSLQSMYGYNEHSLVSSADEYRFWFDDQTQSGISYSEYGNVRLVAGETLAAKENLYSATQRFLQDSDESKKLVAFMPVTEQFARLFDPKKFHILKIGASPYFNLTEWNPRGDKAKKMRAGLNQARRAGVKVEKLVNIDAKFKNETMTLCQSWLKTRRVNVAFDWLFKLAPFQNCDKKQYFAARDNEGDLIGLLAASPIPARDGWYLEDVLRHPDSPNGTADTLVFEALRSLAAEGAKLATLGTIPLAEDGGNITCESSARLFYKAIRLSRRNLESVYGFDGLRRFKAKFVPCFWESEYVIARKGLMTYPKVLQAIKRSILPKGLNSLIINR